MELFTSSLEGCEEYLQSESNIVTVASLRSEAIVPLDTSTITTVNDSSSASNLSSKIGEMKISVVLASGVKMYVVTSGRIISL